MSETMNDIRNFVILNVSDTPAVDAVKNLTLALTDTLLKVTVQRFSQVPLQDTLEAFVPIMLASPHMRAFFDDPEITKEIPPQYRGIREIYNPAMYIMMIMDKVRKREMGEAKIAMLTILDKCDIIRAHLIKHYEKDMQHCIEVYITGKHLEFTEPGVYTVH